MRRSKAWISNTIDWEYSSNLSLMSISSYIEYETGNINEHPSKSVETISQWKQSHIKSNGRLQCEEEKKIVSFSF